MELKDYKVKSEVVDNKYIYIIDDLISKEVILNFFENALTLEYKRTEKVFQGDKFPIFGVDFNPSIFEEKTIIGGSARMLLNKYMNGTNYILARAYINMCHYGDIGYPHRDCEETAIDITVLYYLNSEWKHIWGGETHFYEKAETRLSILPKPGRFVLFPGAIEHAGSIPTRICTRPRLTLALKFELPK